jgi:alkyl sulfatase BDS1-like metallo-beta-lactamase superfamily hydrolase
MNSICVSATNQALKADITLTLKRSVLQDILQQKTTPADAAQAGQLQITGDRALLTAFFKNLDHFKGNFPVIDAATLPE